MEARYGDNADENGSRGDHGLPLDTCRDTSANRLREALGHELERLKPELLRVIDMAIGADVYYLYMGALELVRDHAGKIEAAFHRAYLRRFGQVLRDGTLPTGGIPGASQLSLLAADDLEESLATESLANAIRDTCVEELFGLDQRVGLLINDPELLRSNNPFGPEVVARAMMDALEGFDADIKSRLLVMSQLTKLLPEDVRDVYRDVNETLARRNVLPTIRIGLRRSGSAMVPAAPPAPAQGAPATAASERAEVAEAACGDLFTLFQGLLGGAGNGTALPAGYQIVPAGAVGPRLDNATLLQSLGHLQRGQPGALAWSGLEADTLGSGRVNVLHGLRQGGMAEASTLDTMTLDIVAMMFDYILDDHRVPDAMQALIGRLQIPVLKVAMLDKSFFSRKGHHVRRFLDALAESAVGLDQAAIHESGLYHKAEELVGRILDQFEDRVDIFAEMLVELNAFLEGQRGKVDAAVVTGIEAIQDREADEVARQAAHAAVRECLEGHPIPLVIRDFIVRHWQRLLAGAHRKGGVEGTAWRIALSTMANLIWSVEPKFDPIERASLVALIPSLLKELNMGADTLDVSGDDRELFFATLVPCHTLALKAVVLEDEMLAQPVMVEAALPSAPESNEFEPVRPFRTDTGLRRRTGSAVAPASAKSDIAGLALGGWIEYTRDDGGSALSRLSWISPLKGIYMFSNRDGSAPMSITARGLRAKLHTGEVRILDDAPLMDRVVDSLMARFQNKVV